jgi:hypothetical protein
VEMRDDDEISSSLLSKRPEGAILDAHPSGMRGAALTRPLGFIPKRLSHSALTGSDCLRPGLRHGSPGSRLWRDVTGARCLGTGYSR